LLFLAVNNDSYKNKITRLPLLLAGLLPAQLASGVEVGTRGSHLGALLLETVITIENQWLNAFFYITPKGFPCKKHLIAVLFCLCFKAQIDLKPRFSDQK
jgi:hypothetical protein